MSKVIKILYYLLSSLILVAFVAPLTASILLQFTPVQNFVVDWTAMFISEKIETSVEIGHIDIKFLNRVVIDDIYVEDYNQDTLLFIDRADVAIHSLGMIKRNSMESLTLGRIEVSGVDLNIMEQESGISNLKEILNKIGIKKREKKGDFSMSISSIAVSGFNFNHSKLNQEETPGVINFKDVSVSDLNLRCNTFILKDGAISTVLNNLSFRDKSGFEVSSLKAEELSFNDGSILVDNAECLTPEGELIFEYIKLEGESWKSYSDFENLVKFKANLVDSELILSQIGYFAPAMKNARGRFGDINIFVSGRVSDMEGSILGAKTLDSSVELDFNLKGLPNISSTNFDVAINNISTTPQDINYILKDIIGKEPLKRNKILDRVGKIDIVGEVMGVMDSLDVKADLTTTFGAINSDVTLLLSKTKDVAIDGLVATKGFNVGGLLSTDRVEMVSLSSDVAMNYNAQSKDISFNSDGVIDNLTLNGCEVKDINMSGSLSSGDLQCKVDSDDPNLDFDFEGILNLADSIPNYDFDLKVDNLDLAKLNINKRDSISSLSCRVIADFNGTNLNDINGDAQIRDLRYFGVQDTLNAKNIDFIGRNNESSKFLELTSEFADAKFQSRVSYDELIDYIKYSLNPYIQLEPSKHYVDTSNEADESSDLSGYSLVQVDIKDSHNLASVIMPGLYISKGTRLSFTINPNAKQVALQLDAEYIEYKNLYLSSLSLNSRNERDSLVLYGNLKELYTKGVLLPNIELLGGAKNNKMELSAHVKSTDNDNEILIGATGQLALDSLTQKPLLSIGLKPSFLRMQKQHWNIAANKIIYRPNQITVDEFSVVNSQQQLLLDGVISKSVDDSLKLRLVEFDLQPFSQFVQSMGYNISGKTNGEANMHSVLNNGLLAAHINFDSVQVNDIKLPPTLFDSQWDFQQSRAKVVLARQDMADTIIIGYYRPTDKRYRATISMDSIDLALLDPILKGVVSKSRGAVSVRAELIGQGSKPKVNGTAFIPDFSTHVDFINVPYNLKKGIVKIKDNRLELQPVDLYDPKGNKAKCDMWLDLNSIANMKYQLRINPNNLMVLNTTERDNELFYGEIYGTGSATVAGDRRGVKMDIKANTAGNSKFFLPLSGKSNASKASFLVFKDSNVVAKDTSEVLQRRKLIFQRKQRQRQSNTNMQINMAVNVLPNTEMQVVIDPTVGDIIKGRGNGSFNISINPNRGEFDMYGDYEITQGSYLFTLQNIINKRFVVTPGSSIKWTGDPIDALLDIVAVYEVKASLATLDPEIRGTAEVDCEIQLTDRLSHPTVTFGVKLPDVDPEVRSLVANELNTQEMISTQFFWLLAINSFYSDSNGGTSIGQAGGSATGFEFLSNQLSNWISSDKFNIGIRYRPRSELTSEEVNIDLSTQLFSDRLLLELEGNYDTQNNPAMSNKELNNLSGDFYLTWLIDKVGDLKAKVFSRTMDTFDENQGNQETGVGIYYKENFNRFKDILTNIRNRFSIEERMKRRDEEIIRTTKK